MRALIMCWLRTRRRKYSLVDQCLADSHREFVVDVEDPNGGSRGAGFAHEFGAIPSEMATPLLSPRIKQRDDLPRYRIHA